MRKHTARKAFIMVVIGCAYILSGCGSSPSSTPSQVSLTVLPVNIFSPQSNVALNLKGGTIDLTCDQVAPPPGSTTQCSTKTPVDLGNNLSVIPIIFNSVPTGQYTLSESPLNNLQNQCTINITDTSTATTQLPCSSSGLTIQMTLN
jgi:hypothetical protein